MPKLKNIRTTMISLMFARKPRKQQRKTEEKPILFLEMQAVIM